MGTTADKLQALLNSKESIRLAIEEKGGDITPETRLSEYAGIIESIVTGGGEDIPWAPAKDWIKLGKPANNEILILIADIIPRIAFSVTCTDGYTVDWGDGVVELLASNQIVYHEYTRGTGAVCSRGYTTFKIRIYATNPLRDITNFALSTLGSASLAWQNSLLWIRMGTTKLTSLQSALSMTGSTSAYLEKVSLPESLENCTNFQQMLFRAYSLVNIDMPLVYSSSLIAFANAFNECHALKSINYNAESLTVNSFGNAHNKNYALTKAKLPTTVNSCTSFSSLFYEARSLAEVVMPIVNTAANVNQIINISGVERIVFNSSWEGRVIITDTTSVFGSVKLKSIIGLPARFHSATTGGSSLFIGLSMVSSIDFPTLDNGTYTNGFNMFMNCYGLRTINNFPALSSMTNISQMFLACTCLEQINNIGLLGDTTTNMDLSSTYSGCFALEVIHCRNKITGRFVLSGSTSVKPKLRELLFTNPGAVSTWAGSSPHVDVDHCSMDAAALNAMFTSIIATSASFAGKTVRVRGNPGAATCNTSIITNAGGSVIIA